ncbi:MAG: sulfite dehydrogenase [Cycloclasticus sp. symbiont of Poecilosclerida sp. N]|nr:MAG: sulfite dehydrogenase [Cycloclasticus sp. symbiont of Poecilosclerida sp. N]
MADSKKPETSKEYLAELTAHVPPTSRRDFLKKGVKFSTSLAAVAATSEALSDNLPPHVSSWSKSLGTGVVSTPYGVPSKFEENVIRRTVPWLTADKISSISMSPLQELKGIITPNGLVFERYHAGAPAINPAQHRLMIHGLVDNPLIFTMDDLMRFPSESVINFLECPANGGMEWRGPQMEALQFTHGMISCCEWTGVRLSTLLAEAGVQSKGKWVLAEGADGAGMSRSIPMNKALDDALIVYAQNGEKLRPEQGYPVRLFNPGWEGNTSVKWLRRLKIGDKPWHHREETSKYTDLMPDGRSRRFTYEQEANSVITSPCPENPWGQKGSYEIEGIAWSGRGKIKQVDVSIDGGVTWRPAKLKGLVLTKALTRFCLPFKWDGSPGLLQSRAIDETGYVQPTLSQLRNVRGTNSIYHKNSIHTWQLQSNGKIKNVQLK